MQLTLTLTGSEVAALTGRYPSATIDEAIHFALQALVEKDSERRLQVLAAQYRILPPDYQVEAVELLKAWLATKVPVSPPIVSSDPVLL